MIKIKQLEDDSARINYFFIKVFVGISNLILCLPLTIGEIISYNEICNIDVNFAVVEI